MAPLVASAATEDGASLAAASAVAYALAALAGGLEEDALRRSACERATPSAMPF